MSTSQIGSSICKILTKVCGVFSVCIATLKIYRYILGLYSENILNDILPYLRGHYAWKLTRISSNNFRLHNCYIIFDYINLDSKSLDIYVDYCFKIQLKQYRNKINHMNLNTTNQYDNELLSCQPNNKGNILTKLHTSPIITEKRNSDIITSSNDDFKFRMNFELILIWILYFVGWIQTYNITFLFTMFLTQQLNPQIIHDINDQAHSLMSGIRSASGLLMCSGIKTYIFLYIHCVSNIKIYQYIYLGFSSLVTQLFIIEKLKRIHFNGYLSIMFYITEVFLCMVTCAFYFVDVSNKESSLLIVLLMVLYGLFIELHMHLLPLLLNTKIIKSRDKLIKNDYIKYNNILSSKLDDVVNPFYNNDLINTEKVRHYLTQKFNLSWTLSLILYGILTGFVIHQFNIDFSIPIILYGLIGLSINIMICILTLLRQYHHVICKSSSKHEDINGESTINNLSKTNTEASLATMMNDKRIKHHRIKSLLYQFRKDRLYMDEKRDDESGETYIEISDDSNVLESDTNTDINYDYNMNDTNEINYNSILDNITQGMSPNYMTLSGNDANDHEFKDISDDMNGDII